MTESHIVLVGTTKVLSRSLKRTLPEGAQLEVVDSMERAMALLADRPVALMVLGPTLRRGLAVVTTIRRDAGLKELGLIVVYRDDQREDVKRHLKGRFQADRYIMQSRINQDLRPAVEQLLEELTGDDDAEGIEEIDVDVEEISAGRASTEEVATVLMDIDEMRARMSGDAADAAAGRGDVLESLEEIGGIEVLDDIGADEEVESVEEFEAIDDDDLIDDVEEDDEMEAFEPIDIITATDIEEISAADVVEDDLIEEIGGDALVEIGSEAVEELDGDALVEISSEAVEELDGEAVEELDGEAVEELDGDALVELDGDELDEVGAEAVEALDGEPLEALEAEPLEELDSEMLEEVDGEAVEEDGAAPSGLVDDVSFDEAFAADTLRDAPTAIVAVATERGDSAPVPAGGHRHHASGSQMMSSDLDELTGIIGRLQEARSLIVELEADNERLRDRITALEANPGDDAKSRDWEHQLAEATAGVAVAEAMAEGLQGRLVEAQEARDEARAALEEARAALEEVSAERDAASATLEKTHSRDAEIARSLFDLAGKLEG